MRETIINGAIFGRTIQYTPITFFFINVNTMKLVRQSDSITKLEDTFIHTSHPFSIAEHRVEVSTLMNWKEKYYRKQLFRCIIAINSKCFWIETENWLASNINLQRSINQLLLVDSQALSFFLLLVWLIVTGKHA